MLLFFDEFNFSLTVKIYHIHGEILTVLDIN